MVYIKTGQVELPKDCNECRELGINLFGIKNEWTIADAHCFYRETSISNRGCRPLWCPLVEREIE